MRAGSAGSPPPARGGNGRAPRTAELPWSSVFQGHEPFADRRAEEPLRLGEGDFDALLFVPALGETPHVVRQRLVAEAGLVAHLPDNLVPRAAEDVAVRQADLVRIVVVRSGEAAL